jgi:MFS family permease
VWGFGGVLDLTVPGAVGVALAVIHPADLLAVDALSFAVSALMVRTIRRAMSVPRERAAGARRPLGSVRADIREGLGFLWNHPGVRSMTGVGTLQSIAGAGWVALWVPWADRVLHIGTSGWRFGLVFSVWGLGGILASALTPRLLRRSSAARLTLTWIPVSAVAGLLVALSTQWLLAAVLMTIWGVAYQLVIINSLTYRQQVTPEHLLSRVNTAGRMLSWGVGWTLGALVAGGLSTRIGVRPAMISVVSVGLLAAVYGWLSPLRRTPR